ncbi:MAG: type 2 lanthipeptide synthetase LanM [Ilumatobacteraceae bacterium]
MPFGTLWEPWARACRHALGEVATDEVRTAWYELHLQQCAHWGIRAAHAHFQQHPPSASGVAGYRQWVCNLLESGCDSLFDEFPVLARMLSLATRHAVAAGEEFALRLAADRGVLCDRLGIAPEDPVAGLWAVGDQHHLGRQVLLVRFGSGARLIYKPRPVTPELAMAAVASHVARHGGIDCEITPRMVAGEAHGWSEFVTTVAPRDIEELRTFSRRAGAATAIAHATSTHDLHLENVIVAGDRPVLVDLECIATAPLRSASEALPGRRVITESVLSSYLLPLPERDEALAVDICGLTGTDRQLSGSFGRSWTRLGTTEMAVEPQLQRSTSSAARPAPSSLPLLDIAAFCSGLEVAARAISAHGLGVDAGTTWTNRVVLCDTQSYAVILQQAFEPDNLRDGLSFSIAIDAISGRGYEDDAESWLAELAVAERASLERLDVPMAHGEWRTTDVAVDGVVARNALTHTGQRQIEQNLADLAADRLHLQLGIARVALEGRLGQQRVAAVSAVPASACRPAGGPSADGQVLDTCTAIGDGLLATMVALADGTVEWFAPTHRGERLAPTMGGSGLYNGAAGCALYLAALARHTGRGDFADAALRVFDRRPRDDDPTLGDGQVGWAYAAAVSGVVLDDHELVESAVAAARSALSSVDLARDIDVMAGQTGIALAAASVAVMAGDETLAGEVATLACNARKEWMERVQLNWVEANRLHRLGVAHGITGTSLAVARVLAAADDAGLREWLHELVAEENARIERRDGVPSRVSSDAERRPDTTWCWGVTGFAGARTVVAECLGTPEAHRFIDRAREILTSSQGLLHRLCCGSAGWLAELPADRRSALVSELVAAHGAHLLEERSSYQSPSLFRGTAGVGYQLLRSLDPMLPDLLTFAPAR